VVVEVQQVVVQALVEVMVAAVEEEVDGHKHTLLGIKELEEDMVVV
jgi:hypothetical protein